MTSEISSNPVLSLGKLSSILGVLNESENPTRPSVYKAVVEINDTNHEVALKNMGRKAVANECAANLLGRHLGFTVLDPFLVICAPKILQEIKLKVSGPQVLFATRLAPLKNMNTNPDADNLKFWTHELTSSWFQETYVFDVLIGNTDRAIKNLFFIEEKGKDKYVLLDHQMCLFHPNWTIKSLAANKNSNGDNYLDIFLPFCTEQVLGEIMKIAKNWQGCVTPDVLRPLIIFEKIGLLKKEELVGLYEFLVWRADNLPTLVMKQINLERPYPAGF